MLGGYDDEKVTGDGDEKTKKKKEKGEDKEKDSSSGGGPSLYYMDYLAALQKVKYGGHGYAAYFCLSIMDKEYRDGLNEDAAVAILRKCIEEIKTRMILNQPNFMIKIVDKNGVRVLDYGAYPADT